MIRILGIDPGLRRMGWGVITVDGNRLAAIAHGVVTPPTDAPLAMRLNHIFDAVTELVRLHQPDESAIEEAFMANNASSALKLGHARAAALLAPAQAGLPVAEYAARVVKNPLSAQARPTDPDREMARSCYGHQSIADAASAGMPSGRHHRGTKIGGPCRL